MVIKNYEHRSGRIAESCSIRNVLNYYGKDFKESTIFGLDSAFGFTFFEAKNDKIDIVLGKNEIFTRKSLKLLGVKEEEHTGLAGKEGIKYINENYLKNNIPVIVRLDNALLSYWNVPLEAHFGAYFCVLYGYDEDKGKVYLSDSEFENVQCVDLEELNKARSSVKSPPINPENLIYVLEKSTRVPALEKIGPVSLKNTARNFAASPMGNIGLKGMMKFKKAMRQWPENKTGTIVETCSNKETIEMSTLNFQMKQTGRYIEECGCGGGAYRYIFAEYLKDVYEATNLSEYQECYELIFRSAPLWKEVGVRFLKTDANTSLSEIQDLIQYADGIIGQIYDLEKKTFQIIRRT